MNHHVLKKSKGFTLIELLVVISIISLLSSVVLATVKDVRQKAIDKKFTTEIKSLQNALELYRSTNNIYPEVTFIYPNDPPTISRLTQDHLSTYIKGQINIPRSQITSIEYWSKNMSNNSGGFTYQNKGLCLRDLRGSGFTPTNEELSKPYFIYFQVPNNNVLNMASLYNVGYLYYPLFGGSAQYQRAIGYCVTI